MRLPNIAGASAGLADSSRAPDLEIMAAIKPAGQPTGTASSGAQRCELCLRIASAAILAPLAIGAAYLGGPAFLAFWALAAAGILWEWTLLVGEPSRWRILAIGTAGILVGAALFAAHRPGAALMVVALAAVATAAVAGTGRRWWILLGSSYAGVMLAGPALLRSDAEFGFLAIILLFGVVWATDVMAYFAGRAMAGPKLWPAVSPKKTWSGAIGGVAAGVVVGSWMVWMAGLGNLAALAAVWAGLALAAEAGDLLESALKRRFGAKDASGLIPGHGGLMDRLDGFLAAVLVATLLGLIRGGLVGPARGLLIW
jgi:phosphatidate cytidylyltransferase